MGKLVVLKFGEGSFESGFPVTLQIGEEGNLASTEITAKLPPCGEMPLYYSHWQSSYRRLGNCYRLSANTVQVTNVSITQDCDNTAHILRARFNTWLCAAEFRPIREKWLEKLSHTDEIRVILQTQNYELQRLPWHLWDLLSRYPKAEIALASPIYDRIEKPHTANPKVNILAILGNSHLIDTQADQALLQQLPDADVTFLVEPQRQELTDQLWGKNWDILFFAGHSSSQGKDGTGRIYLNQTDCLTITELNYALRKALERGLQLAIFNSCDGLGLARELADLQIPQIIVMREPVPDLVAQEFLKYFLAGFAGGDSFYLAVRQARERLQGLEDKFPNATWLPVICQNPAQIPPTWSNLFQRQIPPQQPAISQPRKKRRFSLGGCVAITTLLCGLRWLGGLQTAELQAFDLMMRSRSDSIGVSRPDEGIDTRLLVVTIDDADLAAQRRNGESLKGTSLSDKSLKQVLEKLQQYQPSAIGLDIYRDFKAEQQDLSTQLMQTDNLYGVCKGGNAQTNSDGIEPPPEISIDRLGFSDFIHDNDGVVRRHLLWMNPEAASLCPANYALSLQLAYRYLQPRGITLKYTPERNLQLGSTVFPRLSSRAGGYQGIDGNGGQILLNWRSSKKIAQTVTLTQLLSGQVNKHAVKDRIVLIGVVAKGDFPDYWATPYGSHLNEQMPGVLVHAHMVSEILGAVLDGRPLLRTWSPTVEVIWILGWSIVGGVLALGLGNDLRRLIIYVGVASFVLYVVCFGLLIQGYWVPFVPSVLAVVATVGVMSIPNLKVLREGS